MKAIHIARTGGPEVLEYAEVLVRRGTYGWMPPLPVESGRVMGGELVLKP